MDDSTAFEAARSGDVDSLVPALKTAPALLSARDEHGLGLLLAARYHRQDAVVALVREACVRHGQALDVFEAAAVGDLTQLARALAEDPKRANAKAVDGFTPLHLAAFFGGEAATSALVEAGADVNAVTPNAAMLRPLHSAVAAGDEGSARRLLASGADPDVAQAGGWTPLHAACKSGLFGIVGALLAAGAAKAPKAADGQTPLDLAPDELREPLTALLEA